MNRLKEILLVDDNKFFLDTLSYTLKRKNLNVMVAYNVDEAISKVAEQSFDLICSDYDIGDKNGIDLLKYVRSNSIKTKFILLTGSDDYSILNDLKKYGGIYIDKMTPNLIKNIIKII